MGESNPGMEYPEGKTSPIVRDCKTSPLRDCTGLENVLI